MNPTSLNLTEGNQGNEATGLGLCQISKQALLLPLMTEKPSNSLLPSFSSVKV
jgi:hypothetical protein